METTGLDRLEERIRKAAGLIAALRQERESLQGRLEEREKEIEGLQTALEGRPSEDLAPEVERLMDERREILSRVNRMLALLDEAEGRPGGQEMLAAADAME